MKTVIIYCSNHHGNTKKLVDAIAGKHEVELIDAMEAQDADLSAYDMIGFASGIYFGKFHKSVLQFAEDHLPEKKNVFLIYTSGAPQGDFSKAMEEIVSAKHANVLGTYSCQGYDTFGPFKLVGGIAKGHPNNADVQDAVEFYEELLK